MLDAQDPGRRLLGAAPAACERICQFPEELSVRDLDREWHTRDFLLAARPAPDPKVEWMPDERLAHGWVLERDLVAA